jgi:hypothetical protein
MEQQIAENMRAMIEGIEAIRATAEQSALYSFTDAQSFTLDPDERLSELFEELSQKLEAFAQSLRHNGKHLSQRREVLKQQQRRRCLAHAPEPK